MARKITPYEIRRADAQLELGEVIQKIKRRHNIVMSFCNDNLDGGNHINPDVWIVQFNMTEQDKEIQKQEEYDKLKEGLA